LEAILEGFEKFAQKFSELYEEDRPVYLFSVEVDSIEPQRDDIDPSRLKRGRAKIIVKEPSKNSVVTAVVEFRGNTLILSRVNGNCDLGEVGSRLHLEYSKKYPKESLKPDRVLERGRIRHYTVSNPAHFLDFLHLIHTIKGLDIYSRQGEHLIARLVEWNKERANAKTKPA